VIIIKEFGTLYAIALFILGGVIFIAVPVVGVILLCWLFWYFCMLKPEMSKLCEA